MINKIFFIFFSFLFLLFLGVIYSCKSLSFPVHLVTTDKQNNLNVQNDFFSARLTYIDRYKSYRVIRPVVLDSQSVETVTVKTLPFVSLFRLDLSIMSNVSNVNISIPYSGSSITYNNIKKHGYSYNSFLSNFDAVDYYIFNYLTIFKKNSLNSIRRSTNRIIDDFQRENSNRFTNSVCVIDDKFSSNSVVTQNIAVSSLSNYKECIYISNVVSGHGGYSAYLFFPRLPEDISNFSIVFKNITVFNEKQTNLINMMFDFHHRVVRTNVIWQK